MKKFILSALAASALFATGASAHSSHQGSQHYGGGYSHSTSGYYNNVGSYDSYRGHASHGGYAVQAAGYRTYSAPSTNYATPIRVLDTKVSQPYHLATTPTYGYGYSSPAYAPTYNTSYAPTYGTSSSNYVPATTRTVRYTRPYVAPATYTVPTYTYNTTPTYSTQSYGCGC